MPDKLVPRFEARLERRGSTTIVAFGGELDIDTTAQAIEALGRALSHGPATVVVDLEGLRFMDSTGFYCLLDAAEQAAEAGSQLAVLRGSGPAHRVLELTDAQRVIEMVDDLGQLEQGGRRS